MIGSKSNHALIAPSAKPFFKWPGGKSWFASTLSKILSAELTGTYYEPFVGGGAVFFALSPASAVLSDNNFELIDAYEAIRDNPVAVLRAAWRFSNTENCYHKVKQSKPQTRVTKAARFLFLNRTCWGGIYRLNQRGEFNVPFGNSGRVICRKQLVIDGAKVLSNAIFVHSDFEHIMEQAVSGDVVYADPPYTSKGQNNGFIRYNERLFGWTDQERLSVAAHRAAQRGVFVAVSGLWHSEFLGLYSGWMQLKVSRSSTVSRKVASRKPVEEAIVFCRNFTPFN